MKAEAVALGKDIQFDRSSYVEALQSRIPSLDGLRAVSILLVIVAHYVEMNNVELSKVWPLRPLVNNGQMGVNIFFVISGFLITTLLQNEKQKYGSINLRSFYIRRALRIFPAFYAMLIAVALLSAWGVIKPVHWSDILLAGIYLWDYTRLFDPFVIAHSWSLAVEEQFYILWPILLSRLGTRHGFALCVGVIAMAPVIRVATWYLTPELRDNVAIMFHTRADMLAFGCAAALAARHDELRTMIMEFIKSRKVQVLAVATVFVLSPILSEQLRGTYQLTIGYTIEGMAITTVLLIGVFYSDIPLWKFLNLRPVTMIGVLSYSTYLWQQVMFTIFNDGMAVPFPLDIILIMMVSIASFILIERPFLAMRFRFTRK